MEERYRESFSRMDGSPEGAEWELASLHEEADALRVSVRGRAEQTLRWRGPVAYRVIDEAARLRQHPLVEAAGEALVYEVSDSVFLEELGRLSEAALKDQQLRHFIVWTRDQCVDVVASAAPDID